MKPHYAIPLGLLLASQVGAADSPVPAFQEAVQVSFVQHALQGSWEGECLIDAESGIGTSTHMHIQDDASALVVTQTFDDTACMTPTSSEEVVGQVGLVGVSLDEYGQYIYQLAITGEADEMTALSVGLNGDSLTVIAGVSPVLPAVLWRAEQ